MRTTDRKLPPLDPAIRYGCRDDRVGELCVFGGASCFFHGEWEAAGVADDTAGDEYGGSGVRLRLVMSSGVGVTARTCSVRVMGWPCRGCVRAGNGTSQRGTTRRWPGWSERSDRWLTGSARRKSEHRMSGGSARCARRSTDSIARSAAPTRATPWFSTSAVSYPQCHFF